MKLLILDHCAGAALEDPKDCRPYEAAPNNAHPSKSKIAREFDEGICEITSVPLKKIVTCIWIKEYLDK